MKTKVYKILKRYPSLSDHFKLDDYIYYTPIEGDYKEGYIPSRAYVYKKILHQQKDPFIWQDEVENNPEFFEYLPKGIKILDNGEAKELTVDSHDTKTEYPLTPDECYLSYEKKS